MLEKSTLKRLREHDLIELLKKDTNPSQTLNRLRSHADRAMKQSALLARRFPKQTHTQVFNYTNVKELIQAILEGNPNDSSDPNNAEFEGNVIHIAAMLVKVGTDYCIKQYTSRIENSSTLNRATIEELSGACQICDAISFRIYSSQRESTSKTENLIYLFNWNKIGELNVNDTELDDVSDDYKILIRLLKDIISEKIGREIGLTRQTKIELEGGIKRCYLITRFGKGFRCELEINKDEKSLKITIFDEDYSTKLFSRTLIVKNEYETYYVYDKKNR